MTAQDAQRVHPEYLNNQGSFHNRARYYTVADPLMFLPHSPHVIFPRRPSWNTNKIPNQDENRRWQTAH